MGTLVDILVIEMLLAHDLLAARESPSQLGNGTRRLLGDLETVFAGLGPGAQSAEVHAALREKLFG